VSGLSTRAIGRAAVREELAKVALPRFFDLGFDAVTFDDLAGAAGVSRSTFLRYFGSKEDVVLYVFDPLGDQMARALAARPHTEDEWTALRHAVTPAVDLLVRDPDAGLALLRLVWSTPALWARLHEKQASWRPALVDLLIERGSPEALLAVRTRVMAALGCLMVAFDRWVETDGREPLGALTDGTFEALAPAAIRD
jgi:AcrR family transcriptional regulator